MTAKELNSKLEIIQKECNLFAMETYGILLPTIKLNGRIKVKLGSMTAEFDGHRIRPVEIELSKSLLESYSMEDAIDTAKHETIHYCLCKSGKPFLDDTAYFQAECKKHGVGLSGTKKLNCGHIYATKCGCHCITVGKKHHPERWGCKHGNTIQYVGYTSDYNKYLETGEL